MPIKNPRNENLKNSQTTKHMYPTSLISLWDKHFENCGCYQESYYNSLKKLLRKFLMNDNLPNGVRQSAYLETIISNLLY